MSDRYYVRIRGRVHGPMPLTKLQTLAARGQLSRIHEISTDGQTWQPAARMPDLFTSSHASTPAGAATATGQSAATPTEQSPGQPTGLQTAANFDPWTVANPAGVDAAFVDDGADPSETWYYAIDAAQQGPVPRAELVNLIRTGKLSTQDMVWKSDMENWIEAGNVPTLQRLFTQAKQALDQQAQTTAGTTASAETASGQGDIESGETSLDIAILQRLLTCRHWTHLSMIGAFVLSVLFALAGIMTVLSALFASKITILVSGLVHLTYSGLLIWLGSTLVGVNASVKVAETSMSPTSLVDAVESLKPAFKALAWLFLITIGILAIALVVFIVLAAISGDVLDGFVD